jgi:hypothetical protein
MGFSSIVKLLADYNADLNIQDGKGRTALHHGIL